MTIPQYLTALNTLYQTGFSREHSYRPDLQNLLKAMLPPDILVTNEPARINCGAPDYILTRIEIPIGYIEAKDIGTDLNAKAHQEQFTRYKTSLANLIITDYLWFRFYKDGNLIAETNIGKVENGKIVPLPQNFATFTNLIQNFAQTIAQTIKSPEKLAQMMASRAKLMANVIETALNDDDKHHKTSPLKAQMLSFKKLLIHDIENRQFADLYAQTIAYGMFAARYHDPTLPTFSRHEAATLIPKTNPFLRKLFQDIAGYDLDERLTWIVDELVQIFLASDVADIMKNFGQTTRQEDPVIHFYETFLSEYDPKLRKARGVWYTPQPVVNFIVRAVDDILKTEFNLPDGIASTAKTKITTQKFPSSGGAGVVKEVHKVQILDPATGTGTFLAQIIKHIHQKFAGQQGIWSNYVENHLIPRLNGFELLMASYAMAHLKLDMLLTETGYQPTGKFPSSGGMSTGQGGRIRVYLTNSLEEYHPDTGTLFSSWLSDEANQANLIKRDTPVMVVIGNPPYSGESANKGNWIMSLMEDYKKEPGGYAKLNEKNPKWINDDYVKFLRFAQYFIEKNNAGIIAFINPHGYLDNPTFRGMRWNLLKTFDKIYTIDLHGNAKKKETAPNGSPDVNVFDIQQGVSINLFIKTGKKKPNELGKVFHFDLYGQREPKYNFLLQNTLQTINFQQLKPESPAYFFVPKNTGLQAIYEQGFAINELFPVNSVGVVTARDGFTIHHNPETVKETITQFLSLNTEAARIKFDLGNDVRDWSIDMARKDLLNSGPDFSLIIPISYRPFDKRYTYYTGKSKGFHCMPRGEVMQHFIKGENVGLVTVRRIKTGDNIGFFITSLIGDDALSGMSSSVICPLYLYPETAAGQQSIIYSYNMIKETTPNPTEETTPNPSGGGEFWEYGGKFRIPNLNAAIVQQIAAVLGLTFVPEILTSFGGAEQFPSSEEATKFPSSGGAGVVETDTDKNTNEVPPSNEGTKEKFPSSEEATKFPSSGGAGVVETDTGKNTNEAPPSNESTKEKFPSSEEAAQFPSSGGAGVVETDTDKNTNEAPPSNEGTKEKFPPSEKAAQFPSSGGAGVVETDTHKNTNEAPPSNEGTKEKFPPSEKAAQFPSSGGAGVVETDTHKNTNEAPPEAGAGRNTKNYMRLPYNPKLKERARELRKAGNLSEVLLWNQVKNKQFRGFDFDRQKIIGNYIVDFYTANCNVVIEIDGSSHDDKQEYDAIRDAYLESLGLTVIHIPDIEVKKNLKAVMDMLFNHPALTGTPPEEGNFADTGYLAVTENFADTVDLANTNDLAATGNAITTGNLKTDGTFTPIDILDYIYAILHSPAYREKYKEFLKTDFPRVPYPTNKTTFWQLVQLGSQLRQIHLLESPVVSAYITQYPIQGSNEVTKLNYENGKVFINSTQYFANVPPTAWEFYIGGYQPAQKWLKDRKGRTLTFEDIMHYQKIIAALQETHRLMQEVDKVFQPQA